MCASAAVSHIDRALETSDRYSERLYFRGLAELANHHADDAQRDLKHALDDDPSLTVAQLALDAKITAPAQGLEEAIDDLGSVVKHRQLLEKH
jgi:hypothetical protein